MFGWIKRRLRGASSGETIASQPPGEIFPWPKGVVLTAVDEVVLALPMALFDADRPIGDFVFGSDDVQMNIPPDGDTFLIRLGPGMSVSLAKSVESYVVAEAAEDKVSRRIRITRTPGES